MPTKNSKEARRAQHAETAAGERREFYESLPMAGMLFADLFDFLHERLSGQECDCKTTLTEA